MSAQQPQVVAQRVDDGRTLIVAYVHPGYGVYKMTMERRKDEPTPFSDADVERAKQYAIDAVARMDTGEKVTHKRVVLLGWDAIFTVQTGPPTWWRPHCKVARGELMVGWFRGLVAVHVKRRRR